MTIYLNQKLKNNIIEQVKEEVIAKLKTSAVGKEQVAKEKQLKKTIIQHVKTLYPMGEQKIIDKYNMGYKTDIIIFAPTQDGIDVYVSYYFGCSNEEDTINIHFDKNNLYSPTSLILKNWLLSNKEIISTAELALKTKNNINCEIKNTINAFKEELNNFRTIKQLLQKHPTWTKYLNEPKKLKDAAKIIEQFEKG